MDELQEMFHNAIKQNTQLRVQSAELMEANWEHRW